MLNFCTLFDSNFISQGVAMYESLYDCCKYFHLYVIAFDELTLEVLKKLNLSKMTVISLLEFEDKELLSVKNSRSKGEYCWTCSSSAILYCLEHYNLNQCTYIDADLYFYNNPKTLIDEMNGKSVLITRHNYAAQYNQSAISGIYCVQFVSVFNNKEGLDVLKWWRKSVLNWCYARFENGKFGDQKYLDDWTERFSCVHVLQNFGGGLAPWNRTRYSINNKLQVHEADKSYPLCFYHFHDLKFQNGKINRPYFLVYKMSATYLRLLYIPYILKLLSVNRRLRKISKQITPYRYWNIFRIIFLFIKKRLH